MIAVENKKVYVYHSEASELTGLGGVRREELNSFLSGAVLYDIFEFTLAAEHTASMLDTVRAYYHKQTPFDLEFNSFSDDRLYCTELIAVSANKVSSPAQIQPTLILNGKAIYSLDDIYSHKYVRKTEVSGHRSD